MPKKLMRSDLLSLEEYTERRNEIRSEIMAHKKNRQISLGEHLRLYFEDEKTIRYQIQEMLRIEKVFEKTGIQDELDAYNPLIPDGSNWKATMMLEYEDINVRKQKVTELIGIENKVWMQVAGFEKIYPIADEDLEREDGERTSTIHFLRFELTPPMIAAAKRDAAIFAGIDHPRYLAGPIQIETAVRKSLVNDLASVSIN
jgi:hypothetical protein